MARETVENIKKDATSTEEYCHLRIEQLRKDKTIDKSDKWSRITELEHVLTVIKRTGI